MNKNRKISIIAAAVIIPSIIGAFFVLQFQTSAITPIGPTQPSINSSPVTVTSLNSQIIPVGLGTPVTIDSGNMTGKAVDPNTGRIYVAYYKSAGWDTNLFLVSSDNNGKTWTSPVQINDISGDASMDDVVPPEIKVAPNGDLYAAWVYNNYTDHWTKGNFIYGYTSLRVAHSSDGGKTFSKAAHIDTKNYGKWAQEFEDLAISPDSKTVYIAWINANGTVGHWTDLIMVAKSTDGAQTFTDPVAVDGQNPACSCCKVNMVVDNNGAVYIAWRKLYTIPELLQNGTYFENRPWDDTLDYREIVVAKSTDGAQTFSAPVKVYDDKNEWNGCVMAGPQMAIDSNNNLHIVWYTSTSTSGYLAGVYYAVSTDGGKSFDAPITLTAGKMVGPSLGYLAMDSKDNAWVVWEDRSGENSTMWMYVESPPTKLAIAKISPDGSMSKAVVTVDSGKLPEVLVSNGNVDTIWASKDFKVKFAPIITS